MHFNVIEGTPIGAELKKLLRSNELMRCEMLETYWRRLAVQRHLDGTGQ